MSTQTKIQSNIFNEMELKDLHGENMVRFNHIQENIINLRDELKNEISNTTYLTHGIHNVYPAKFIPQVIAYVLKKYAKSGIKIFDPFAGYGTVGVVSRVYGYDYELWDLNPIINIIHDTAIMERPKINILELMKEIKNSKEDFIPKWSNLNYWFP